MNLFNCFMTVVVITVLSSVELEALTIRRKRCYLHTFEQNKKPKVDEKTAGAVPSQNKRKQSRRIRRKNNQRVDNDAKMEVNGSTKKRRNPHEFKSSKKLKIGAVVSSQNERNQLRSVQSEDGQAVDVDAKLVEAFTALDVGDDVSGLDHKHSRPDSPDLKELLSCDFDYTDFHLAILKGDIDQVVVFINHLSDLSEHQPLDSIGMKIALNTAAFKGNLGIIILLIRNFNDFFTDDDLKRANGHASDNQEISAYFQEKLYLRKSQAAKK